MAAVGRLTRQLSEERASLLAQEAIALSQSGLIEVSICDSEITYPEKNADISKNSKPHGSCAKLQH